MRTQPAIDAEARLGTRFARLGSLQNASPAYAAVTSVPTAYPQIWAWRNWLLIRPLPQLSHAPDFFISCGACRSGHARGVPLPANPSVGAALRADRTTSRPCTPDASERRPYQLLSPLKTKLAALLPRACFSLPNYFHPVIAAGDTRMTSPNASSTRITVAIVGLPPGANAR